MRYFKTSLILGLLALHLTASAAEVSNSAPTVQIPFEKYTLANGLQVILAEDKRLPMVAANLRFHVGSANDPPGRTGFAHLFEHLYAFSGPDDFPSPQSVGATQDGATTDADRTTYYTTLPSSQLELLLAQEADRLRYFLDRLDASLLNKERSNVRNERRLVIENEPYGLADEAMFQQLFPSGHPYHAKYLGSHADLEAARLDEAQQFFKKYYVPSNASLVIAGDIDKARAKALIEKYLGGFPAGSAVAALKVSTPAIGNEKRVTVTDRITLPRVSMAWVTPGWYQPGSAEAELMAIVLGNSASRLRESLVRRKQLAQQVVAEYLPFAHASVLVIKATANPGTKPEDIERAIEDELSVLRKQGLTAAELEQARNTVTLQIVRGLEKLGDITAFGDFTMDSVYGGVAEQLNQCNHLYGNPGCVPEVLARYRSVTPATLRQFAEEKLSQKARVVIHAVAGEKVTNDVPASEVPVDEQRKVVTRSVVVPPAGPASAITLPAPQRFKLANGLTVLLTERRHLPIVTANLVIRRGSASSPMQQPGLAAFTMDMLLRGTSRRDATQIATAAGQLGTEVNADISSDAAALGIRVLKNNLDAAFDLLGDVTMNSVFPQQEVDRLREDQLARLAQLRTNPDTLASHLFTEALYGNGHPYRGSGLFNDDMFARTHRYGYDEFGAEQSLQSLTREQLLDFWKGGYTPDNAALVVVGDISADELQVMAQKHFGKWVGTAAQEPARPVKTEIVRRVIVADHGAASQTALRVGTVAASRGSADLVPLRMLNLILGEVYASRITTNLRVEHNYTYMARSQFAFRREPGPFVIGTNVRTEVTAPALVEIFNEIGRVRAEPVTDEDLGFARNAFEGSLVGLFETSGKATTGIGQIFTYDLPLDYYQSLPKQIAAVTASDIQRAAQRYLDPKHMLIIAVGDRAVIVPELRKLDLGAVSVE